MIVTRLEAKNYRQHPTIDADFDGQLVGLIGENGTGKSNFLKAIRYGFIGTDSGETKHPVTKRLPYIRWGEESGFVKIHFTHKGKIGEICRTFTHKKTDASFNYDGMKCEGTTNVNNAVSEQLGMEKEVARQAVFVGQDELDSILFTDPRVRKLAWQKLCGIGQVNNIHTKMGDVLKSLPPVQDYDGQIRDAEFQLVDLEEEFKTKSATLEEAKKELPKENNSEKQAGDLRKMQVLQRDSLSLKADVDNRDRVLATEEVNLVELEKKAYDSDTATKQLEEFRVTKQKLEAAKAAVDTVEAIKNSITNSQDSVTKTTAALQGVRSEQELNAELVKVKSLQEEVSKLAGTGRMYTKLSEALTSEEAADMDSCSLCGQGIADPEMVKRHVAEQSTAIHSQIAEKSVAADDSVIQNELTHRRNLERELALSTERLNGFNNQLKEWESSDTNYDYAIYMDTIAKMSFIESELDQAKRHVANVIKLRESVRLNKESRQVSSDKLAKLISEAQELMRSAGITPMSLDQQLAEVLAEQQRVRGIEVKVATLTGEVTQLTNNIATLKGTIESIETKRESQSDVLAKREVLENVRDWFHYNKGPSIIINNLLDEITVAVNDFLSKFDSLFSVVPNYSSMSFNYYYHDPEIPIDDPYPHCAEMSGGEKVVLAVAFRLATYAMFAQRVGLLVLDEPSVYLDSKNVGKLGTLLYSIKSLAKNLGLQVFISTHEESLMNHFDKIVNFGTKNKEQENG
jgi:DNA repair exonuclease SbcCD ATPase subunit